MTQPKIVLQRIKRGWYSTVDAVTKDYILRLSARICELRADGYNIKSRLVKGKKWSEYKITK